MQRRACLLWPLAAAWLASPARVAAAAAEARQTQWPGMERLSLDMAANVTIRPGPGRLTITAERAILDRIKTSMAGGMLVVSGSDNASDRSPVSVLLECEPLSELHLLGALDVRGERCLARSKALVKVQGASDVHLKNLQGGSLQLDISGSTTVNLAGQFDHLAASIHGASDLDASALKCRRVSVEADGSGDLQVWALSELDAALAGAVTLKVRGQPRIHQKVSGSASLESWAAGY